jgi:hypothetical protein
MTGIRITDSTGRTEQATHWQTDSSIQLDRDANGRPLLKTTAGGISGSGTTNTLPKWTASTTLGDSIITDDGSKASAGNITRRGFAPTNWRLQASIDDLDSAPALLGYNHGTVSTTDPQGMEGYVTLGHTSGTAALGIGTVGIAEATGAGGTTTWLRGMQAQFGQSAGTVTNAAALYIATQWGTITNAYGVYIEDVTVGASTRYALYAAGSGAGGKAYIGGSLEWGGGSAINDSDDVVFFATTAAGDTIRRNSGNTAWERLAVGGAATFLRSDGSIPSWQSIAWGDVSKTGSSINDVEDVTITSVADNEILQYDNGTSDWINQTFAEAGIVAYSGTPSTNHFLIYDGSGLADSSVTEVSANILFDNSTELRMGSWDGDHIYLYGTGASSHGLAVYTNTSRYTAGTSAGAHTFGYYAAGPTYTEWAKISGSGLEWGSGSAISSSDDIVAFTGVPSGTPNTNYLQKYDGTGLTDSVLSDDGTDVAVDVNGKVTMGSWTGDHIYLYGSAAGSYGFGIETNELRAFAGGSASHHSWGYYAAGPTYTERMQLHYTSGLRWGSGTPAWLSSSDDVWTGSKGLDDLNDVTIGSGLAVDDLLRYESGGWVNDPNGVWLDAANTFTLAQNIQFGTSSTPALGFHVQQSATTGGIQNYPANYIRSTAHYWDGLSDATGRTDLWTKVTDTGTGAATFSLQVVGDNTKLWEFKTDGSSNLPGDLIVGTDPTGSGHIVRVGGSGTFNNISRKGFAPTDWTLQASELNLDSKPVLLGYADTTSSSNIPQGCEGYATADHSSGTLASAIGLVGNAEHTNAGDVTWLRGLQGGAGSSGDSGATVANAASFYAANGWNTGVSDITNYYGLYIASITVGTNQWAIYTAGSDKTYLGGTLEWGGGSAITSSDNVVDTSTANTFTAAQTLDLTGDGGDDALIFDHTDISQVPPASYDSPKLRFNAYYDDASTGAPFASDVWRIGAVSQSTSTTASYFEMRRGAGSGYSFTPDANTGLLIDTEETTNILNIVSNGTTGVSSVWFSDDAAEGQGRVRYEHTGDRMELWAGGAEQVAITAGVVTLSSGTTLTVRDDVVTVVRDDAGDLLDLTTFGYGPSVDIQRAGGTEGSPTATPAFAGSNIRFKYYDGSPNNGGHNPSMDRRFDGPARGAIAVQYPRQRCGRGADDSMVHARERRP